MMLKEEDHEQTQWRRTILPGSRGSRQEAGMGCNLLDRPERVRERAGCHRSTSLTGRLCLLSSKSTGGDSVKAQEKELRATGQEDHNEVGGDRTISRIYSKKKNR